MDNIQDVVAEVSNSLHPFDIQGEFLGAGCFSRAELYKGVVIKKGGIKEPDPGGLLWAKFCVQHQHLDAVPKVYYLKEFTEEDGYEDFTYIVVMESLRCMDLASRTQRRGFSSLTDYICYDETDSSALIPDYIQEFRTAFLKIRECGRMDMHDHNYMLRPSDGCMVIIDPFSGTDEGGI